MMTEIQTIEDGQKRCSPEEGQHKKKTLRRRGLEPRSPGLQADTLTALPCQDSYTNHKHL